MRNGIMPGLLLALLAQAAFGQTIYEGAGPGGQPLFSDQPFEGARPVPLPTDNVARPPQPEKASAEARPAPAVEQVYTAFSIVFPENDGAAIANDLSFEMQVSVVPPLLTARGHSIRISVDGRPVEGAFTGTSFMVPAAAFDGDTTPNQRYQLEAAIVDDQGRVLKTAGPVSFYLRHATIRKRLK